MTKGLLWLPLLAVFCWLAWAGWNEYQKLEAYRRWAEPFDHAKYDIYAVLGQQGSQLTWGKPTRQGPSNLQTFSLKDVKAIQLQVDDRLSDIDHPPASGQQIGLAFQVASASQAASNAVVVIPFTDLALAIQWGQHLQQDWQALS